MKRVLSMALTLLVCVAAALAQSNTGRLVGTVSDPSGVIPGATLVVRDNQTGKERTLVTTDDGSFTVPQLDPGTYTVTITAQGHKTYTASDVKIDIGKDYSLNPVLEVGQISESITVVAGADVVNATNGELTNTVSPRQIQELPLNGRNPLNLIGLQAGTASNGAQPTVINGQRSTFTNVTRDGLNVQDNYLRETAADFSPERPSVDDTAEFTITTQNASADQGYGASQVQLVTPRGQNEFHGAVFEYNRNSKFAANDFFRNAAGNFAPNDPLVLAGQANAGDPRQPQPFLNRNQFGGRVQGPIVKNKLFFFASYEGLRLRTASNQTRTILLPNARNGIFTYIDNSGNVRTVNLLTLVTPTKPALVADPVVQSRLIAPTPTAGNRPDIGDRLNTTGFAFNQKADQDRNAFSTRIDYDINDRNTINGVFTFKKETVLRPDAANNFDVIPDITQPADNKFLALAWRTTPSANLTNEVRGGIFFSEPLFLKTSENPSAFITSALVSNPDTVFLDQGRNTKYYNIQDNAEYAWGNHSFRFGGQMQFFRLDTFFDAGIVPTFTLGTNTSTPRFVTADFTNAALFPGGISTTQRTTANQLLALIAGIAGAGTQTFNVATQTSGFVPGQGQRNLFAYENHSLYFADQWRVSPTFTLNLGLRYELYTALREEQGLFIEPAIAAGTDPVTALLDPNGTYQFVGGNAGGNRLYNTDKNNFAPVISFAWSPQFKNKFLGSLFGDGRTVIRGGFRMSYVNDQLVVSQQNSLGLNDGLAATVSALNPANGTANLNARAASLPTIPAPAFRTLPRNFASGNTATQNFFGTVFGIDPNLQIPRTEEYNFGIQREIGWQTALEVRYVGGRSNSLVRALDFNQLRISPEFITDFNNAAFNLNNFGAADCTAPGCLPVGAFFNQLGPGGAFFGLGFTEGYLAAGIPADFAVATISPNLPFFPNAQNLFLNNPNTGVVDLVGNYGKYRYNSLQVELRRRFSDGLYFQANYTFQKTLTNTSGTRSTGQSRFDPNLDNANPNLEYARADYDQTHVFNLNTIYELPFGKGKRWLSEGEWVNRLIGGWQITSIVNVSTGAPITITDARGTLNRVGRSARQTPQTSLTKDQIKELIGIYRTPCGIFFINPSVIDINLSDCSGSGRAALGYGTAAFPGQVFFNNGPFQTGGLDRAFINGPLYVNWDAGLIKNIQLTERVRLQLRAEAFNLLNRTNFGFTAAQQTTRFDINSATFGRVTTGFSSRIVQFAGRIEF